VTASRPRAPLVGVTMSLHKLSAGHGYDYAIRQVAALDATRRGRTDLASYYAERGEARAGGSAPGWPASTASTWGNVVTGEQMRLLFVRRGPPPARRNVAGRWSGVDARCPVPAVDRGAAVPGGAAGPVRRSQHRAGPQRCHNGPSEPAADSI
jgi:hypothetical protein